MSEPPPALVGVDVVARARRASTWGDVSHLERLLTARERTWAEHDESGVRSLVCISVKESVVKALGGRPDPWDWRGISFVPKSRSAPGGLAGLLDDLCTGVRTDQGAGSCTLDEPAARRARQRLDARPDERLRIRAGWASNPDRIVTVVLVSVARRSVRRLAATPPADRA